MSSFRQPRDTSLKMAASLPTDAQARKEVPIATGFMAYFPRAVAAIARLSWLANEKHNPGEPLHWSREKSSDHADCHMRHFMQRGTMDTLEGEEVLHIVESAWRVLALAELELEERAALNPLPGAAIKMNLKPGQSIGDVLRAQMPDGAEQAFMHPDTPKIKVVQFYNPETKKYQTWTLNEDKSS